MYSVDRAASQPKAENPVTTAPGPSIVAESASSGSGTTSADQTVSPSPPGTPAARETTLPQAHDSAAARHSSSATSGTWPPRPSATTSKPTTPMATPAAWARVGHSRSTPAAITIVSTTCAWSTRPASPAGIPAAIAE